MRLFFFNNFFFVNSAFEGEIFKGSEAEQQWLAVVDNAWPLPSPPVTVHAPLSLILAISHHQCFLEHGSRAHACSL